jgi:hypothetical protein
MKTKIKILIVSFVIAVAAVTGLNLAQESSDMDLSLADIAVMAKATGEGGDISNKKQMQGTQGTFCCCPGSLTCGSSDCKKGVC